MPGGARFGETATKPCASSTKSVGDGIAILTYELVRDAERAAAGAGLQDKRAAALRRAGIQESADAGRVVHRETHADAGLPDVVQRPSRLRALAAMEPNAESSADALDRIAGMACRLLEAPVALVNLVGSERQRLVGYGGDDPLWSVRELPLTHGFCPFALGAEHAFAFADARAEPSLAANPVVEQLGVLAYAGVPLRVADGEPIGTLCAIDHSPHAWSEDDLANLSDLAASAVTELQLLAASRRAARQQARVRTLAALSYALAPAASADEMIEQLGTAVDRVNASVAWLAVLDESGRELRTAVGVDPPLVRRLPSPPVPQPDFLPTRQDVRDRFEAPPDIGSAALLQLAARDRCLASSVWASKTNGRSRPRIAPTSRHSPGSPASRCHAAAERRSG